MVSFTGFAAILNLDDQVVPAAARGPRIIEIVSADADDRAFARERWRAYKAAGHTLVQRDLTREPA